MGPADSPSRRQCQRAAVEQVALTLFLRDGFDAVTVEQIAAEAGIAPATFYRYFATKQGVLFAYQDQFMAAARAAAGTPSCGDRARDLERALYCFAAFLEKSADMVALRDKVVSRTPSLMPATIAVQRQWEDELAAGLATGRGLETTDLAARLDAAAALVLLRAAFRRWRADPTRTLHDALSAVLTEAARLP